MQFFTNNKTYFVAAGTLIYVGLGLALHHMDINQASDLVAVAFTGAALHSHQKTVAKKA